MAAPRVVLRTDGGAGTPGSTYPTRNRSSSGASGNPGAHGRNATDPSTGKDGGDVYLEFSRSDVSDEVGKFTVTGYKKSAGYRMEVPYDGTLFISARGGIGGNGGWGEGGQDGDRGYSGTDATARKDGGVSRSHCFI